MQMFSGLETVYGCKLQFHISLNLLFIALKYSLTPSVILALLVANQQRQHNLLPLLRFWSKLSKLTAKLSELSMRNVCLQYTQLQHT